MEETENAGARDEEVDDMIEVVAVIAEIEMAVDVQCGLTNTDLQQEPIIGLRWKICRAGLAGRI